MKEKVFIYILVAIMVFSIFSIGIFAFGGSSEKTCITQTIVGLPVQKVPKVETIKKVEELKIEDIEVGIGKEAIEGDCVVAQYHGVFASDGEELDSTFEAGTGLQVALDEVIEGWSQGVPGMKVGGYRKLTIPANLGYGQDDLIFYIRLVDIVDL